MTWMHSVFRLKSQLTGLCLISQYFNIILHWLIFSFSLSHYCAALAVIDFHHREHEMIRLLHYIEQTFLRRIELFKKMIGKIVPKHLFLISSVWMREKTTAIKSSAVPQRNFIWTSPIYMLGNTLISLDHKQNKQLKQ